MELQDILAKTSAKVILTRSHGVAEMRTKTLTADFLDYWCICGDVHMGVCRTSLHGMFICLYLYICAWCLQIPSSESFLVF